jgi:branched-chain amino acid transport system substrate-binding protein
MSRLSGTIALLLAGGLPVAGYGQISDGVVKIAVITDLSGGYADNVGPGSVVATQLAIEDFGGKVLGKPIEVVTTDHQNRADVAATKVRELLDREKVDVVTEFGNSAVALASMKVATEKNKIALVTGAGATRISGEDCAATTFHWVYDSYALANVSAKTIVADGGTSWFFITADYAFGQALESDGSKVVKAAGGSVLGSARYPFPGSDFSSYLLKAQGSGAKVVALANAALDTQTSMKQANEFGLTRSQKIVAMLMSINDIHAVGLDAAQGMYYTDGFYWDLDEQSRTFAKRFYERHKRMPTMMQAGQYSAVLSYLKAVEATKTDETSAVARHLRSMKIHDAFARNGKVRSDGKMIHDMYLVQVKAPKDSKYPWDYNRVVKTVSGDEAFAPLSASACPLVKK